MKALLKLHEQDLAFVVLIPEEDLNLAIVWLENQEIQNYFWQHGHYKKTKFVFWSEEAKVLFALRWA